MDGASAVTLTLKEVFTKYCEVCVNTAEVLDSHIALLEVTFTTGDGPKAFISTFKVFSDAGQPYSAEKQYRILRTLIESCGRFASVN